MGHLERVIQKEERQEGGSEMETERSMSHDTTAEEDRPHVERGEKRKEEKQETAEERGQMEEEAIHREAVPVGRMGVGEHGGRGRRHAVRLSRGRERLSGGRMMDRMKAAGYKGRLSGGRRRVAKDKMAVTGGSMKMGERKKVICDKKEMTGVEELELKRRPTGTGVEQERKRRKAENG